MGWLSIRKSNPTVSASRDDLRKLLRKARKGNTQAFRSVSDHYLNFITEYLVVSGYTKDDRIRHLTRDIFHNLWQRIAYIRRVSDFERQMFMLLKQIPVNVAPFQDVLIQKLVMLNFVQRFLIVGSGLEDWTTKNLSLATRIPKPELSHPLYDAWRTLVNFKQNDLDFHTNQCMQKVVECLEGFLENVDQQRLCKKLSQNSTASNFKADCLHLRCELIELRQNARWKSSYKEKFLNELTEDIAEITPLKPELSAILKNQVSFQYIPIQATN